MTQRWMPDAAKLDEHVRRVLRQFKEGGTLDEVTRAAWVSFGCEPLEPEIKASLDRIVAAGGAEVDGDRWRWRSKRGARKGSG